ncbi:hypothetical protein LCGC14_0298430 [marine sediment metagenome]|uniref:Uncharacterized protein n=1 Tax=marine sediment metagenome TaxID=412755 RepID=A0A0F9WX62_9ZZZZ
MCMNLPPLRVLVRILPPFFLHVRNDCGIVFLRYLNRGWFGIKCHWVPDEYDLRAILKDYVERAGPSRVQFLDCGRLVRVRVEELFVARPKHPRLCWCLYCRRLECSFLFRHLASLLLPVVVLVAGVEAAFVAIRR